MKLRLFFKNKFTSQQLFWSGLFIIALIAYVCAPEDDIPEALDGKIQLQRQGKSHSAPSTPQVQTAQQNSLSHTAIPSIDWKLREAFPIQNSDAFRSPTIIQPVAPTPKMIVPVIVPPPPPKPVAPPLAFEYLGKIGNVHAVQKNDEIYELVPGQVIANDYRVEKINETEAVLIYIPLNEPQTLALKTKDE
ncbi:MAG: hypothetical protein V4525_08045 [Pseudomonadota bacterium]